jgi:hypothetical protein
VRVTLAESTAFGSAATPAEGPGRLLIELITPGWGSSGYYSQDLLEAAGRDRIWPAGTHMYIDHPAESEMFDRPERTVKDLAAVLTEDARWDAAAGALVAEARVFSHWRQPLVEMADVIGVSVRGSAEGELGEAEGRTGRVFSRLTAGESVDFVTRAGRGGKVAQVIESARHRVTEARNVGQWVESRIHRDFTVLADEMFGDGRLTREERITLSGGIGDALAAFVARVEADAPGLYERDVWDQAPEVRSDAVEAAIRRGVAEATANDRRDQLDSLVKAEHGGEGFWTWVRDFDDTTVWFQIDGGDDTGTYQQAYDVDDDVATALTGERTEVRAQTTYVPVDPAGQSNPQESEEDTMPQIEEARLRQLEEAHGRVPTLESERDAERQRADTAEAKLAEALKTANTAVAEKVVREAFDAAGVTAPKTVARLAASAPLTEAGAVDEAALKTAAEESAAELAEASGAGRVRGFGGDTLPTDGDALSESDVDAAVGSAFGRQVKEA